MAAFGSNLISRLTVSVLAPVEVTTTVYVAKGHVLLPQVVVVTDAISSAPAVGLSTPATRTKKAIGAIANVSRRVSLFMGLSNVASQRAIHVPMRPEQTTIEYHLNPVLSVC